MFRLYDTEITSVEPFMEIAKTSMESYELGEALKVADGAVTKCGPTDKATYIYMGEKGDQAIVMPVLATRRFEVPYTALPTVGKKVTLHTDGFQITSTDTGGVFDVVSVDQASGTATGYFR